MIFNFKLSISFLKHFAILGGGHNPAPALAYEGVNFHAHVTVSTSNMASAGPLPGSILDVQPELLEVTTHARTAEWFLLGTQLKLDDTNLAGCNNLTRTYQLWIQEKAENATRRNLLNALRAINQNNVAKKYEDHLRTLIVGVSY